MVPSAGNLRFPPTLELLEQSRSPSPMQATLRCGRQTLVRTGPAPQCLQHPWPLRLLEALAAWSRSSPIILLPCPAENGSQVLWWALPWHQSLLLHTETEASDHTQSANLQIYLQTSVQPLTSPETLSTNTVAEEDRGPKFLQHPCKKPGVVAWNPGSTEADRRILEPSGRPVDPN